MTGALRTAGLTVATVGLVLSAAACTSGGEPSVPSSSSAGTQPTVVTPSVVTPSSSATSPTSPGTTSTTGSATTPREVDLNGHEFAVDVRQALRISQQQTGPGTVHSLELDWSARHAAWVWQIDTLVGTSDHDVQIHADRGTVLAHDQERTDDREQAVDPTSPLPVAEAMAAALALREGTVRSWKLEWDDGRREYQFDIEQSGRTDEVLVDVETGQARLD